MESVALAAMAIIFARGRMSLWVNERAMPASAMGARGCEIGVAGLRRVMRCHSRRAAEQARGSAG